MASSSATASESAEATCTCTETGDASGSDPGSSSSDAVPSLLSRLRALSQSEIMRKRNVRVNPPHTGGRKKKPACSTDPMSVSVVQRVNEFLGEMLTNSAGKRSTLFPASAIYKVRDWAYLQPNLSVTCSSTWPLPCGGETPHSGFAGNQSALLLWTD